MLVRAAAGCAHEGDWLSAERQTAGRGRMGRHWVSPPGNLYASGLVRLRPGDPAAATLALVTAVALHEAIAIFAPGVALMLKWPNDVLARGAKLGGILLERAGEAVVIGVGVNLAHHPDGLDRPVTSLAALGIAPPEPVTVLAALADVMSDGLARWRGAGLNAVRTAWLARAHPVGTALSAALPDGRRIDGLFQGLTEDCALRLGLADGQGHVIHAGDVFLI